MLSFNEITLSKKQKQVLVNTSNGKFPQNGDFPSVDVLRELGLVEWIPPDGLKTTLRGKQYLAFIEGVETAAKKVDKRYRITTGISIIALGISIVAIVISVIY